MKYRRGIINKQRAKISEMWDFPNSSYWAKGITENYRVYHGDAMLEPRGGVLPYMGYIGMCGPKGYGFLAVLVINRVSILADFGHFGHK